MPRPAEKCHCHCHGHEMRIAVARPGTPDMEVELDLGGLEKKLGKKGPRWPRASLPRGCGGEWQEHRARRRRGGHRAGWRGRRTCVSVPGDASLHRAHCTRIRFPDSASRSLCTGGGHHTAGTRLSVIPSLPHTRTARADLDLASPTFLTCCWHCFPPLFSLVHAYRTFHPLQSMSLLTLESGLH